MDNKLKYLGMELDRITTRELLKKVKLCVEQRKKLTASYFGAHTANIIRVDNNTKETFRSLNYLMADGIAVVLTSRFFGEPLTIKNRINGDIFAPILFKNVQNRQWSFFLLGATKEVLNKATASIQNAFADLKIVGTHHGFMATKEEELHVIEEINRSKADIVLVGLGQPYQEKWIITYQNDINAPFLMGVGGYFDHVARRIDCYPSWIYKLRLNWAYRLIKEPRRLWKRYTIEIVWLLWSIVKYRVQQIFKP